LYEVLLLNLPRKLKLFKVTFIFYHWKFCFIYDKEQKVGNSGMNLFFFIIESVSSKNRGYLKPELFPIKINSSKPQPFEGI